MALTHQQKEKIVQWRKSKGVENCIACDFSGEMNYGDVVALPTVGSNGQTVISSPGAQTVISGSGGQTVISGSGGRVIINGEEIVPTGETIPITCPNCGYTMLFSKEVLPL